MLFNDGKNIEMISQRLGHSDVGITLSVYAHLAPDAQGEAAESIERVFFAQDYNKNGASDNKKLTKNIGGKIFRQMIAPLPAYL